MPLMDYEEFMQHLQDNDEWECTCFINPPCSFCTDGVSELYEKYSEEGK